jgi:hypothetical protein
MNKFFALILTSLALRASAAEGMWTFDHFPVGAVREQYGVEITPAWLDHVRSSTVRLANCTGSFVSAQGLILTNHHCAEACLSEVSTRERSFDETGFAAVERSGEKRCETQVADVLMGVVDITPAVLRAVAGLPPAVANEARKQALTRLEQNCETESRRAKGGPFKCQSVKLYQGAQYFLYKYRRYDDVRLVFAPERDIAGFGGDPDNFQFPRWSLDVALLRAYERGRPAKTPAHFTIDFEGPHEHEPVFVAGHPGTTSRLSTLAQLQFERIITLPNWLLRASELRGGFIQFGQADPEADRIVLAPLHALENTIKVRRTLLDTLNDEAFVRWKSAQELQARQALAPGAEDPWAEISAATVRERALYLPYLYLESGAGFNSGLFRYARVLVRASEERSKPNGERLREYVDAALPRLEQQLFVTLPVYPELEVLTMSFSLRRLREWLGPDDPLVRRLLANDSPHSLAAHLVDATQLNDPQVRKRLWDGGKAAIAASEDPMIDLVRSIDTEARAVRKRFEDEVEAPVAAAAERIGAQRLAADGAGGYPDATFTLRLNYGEVEGWVENGVAIPAFTHLDRAFERATGVTPFKIPDSWMNARARLDPHTPFCLSTSNDIVGGNSGSPLIGADGRIVGLMFDGNIHSIAGEYWFDPAKNRAIALHPAIIRAALEKVYEDTALMRELQSP